MKSRDSQAPSFSHSLLSSSLREILYLLCKRIRNNRVAVFGKRRFIIEDSWLFVVDTLSSLEMHEIAFCSLRYLGQLSHELNGLDTCCPTTPLCNNGRRLLQINLVFNRRHQLSYPFCIHLRISLITPLIISRETFRKKYLEIFRLILASW